MDNELETIKEVLTLKLGISIWRSPFSYALLPNEEYSGSKLTNQFYFTPIHYSDGNEAILDKNAIKQPTTIGIDKNAKVQFMDWRMENRNTDSL